MVAMGSPVIERSGMIINQPAKFLLPGPTSTERYSQASDDGGEYDPRSTLSLGSLAGLSKPKHLNPSSTLGFLDATCTTKSSKIHVPDEIIAEAHTLVSKAVEINPDALGIVLMAHNERAHEVIHVRNLYPLDGIENVTLQLKNVFANLGLAVVRLENPSKQLLEAVIQAISSNESPVKFPLSYRYFFFYTTGHGADRVFFTYDGSISYYDVIESFTNTQRFVQKYFFFDCCRFSGLDRRSEYPNGDRILPFVPQIITHPENRIIFSSTDGAIGWGPGEGLGVSYMTRTMVKLLAEPLTLDELIRRLQKDVHFIIKKGDPTRYRDAIWNTINLSEERNQKMQPSIGQVVFKNGANISVQLRRPLALNNEDSIYEMCKVQYRHIGEADWKEQQPTVHGPSTPLPAMVDLSVSLPTDGHDDCQQVEFRVVAYYKGGLVVPSKPIHTVLPDLVRPTVKQPTFQDGGYVANFAVQLNKPLAVNNDNSSCQTCVLEYRRTSGSDVEWKTLELRPTDGATTPTALELPTTVGLSVFLPTDHQQVEFRVLAHFNGGLVVPSETIRTDLPFLDSEVSHKQFHFIRPAEVCEALRFTTSIPFVEPIDVIQVGYEGGQYLNVSLGVHIDIPKGAVPKGSLLRLEIGVSLYGPFEYPPESKPVSPILMLCPQEDIQLQKAVRVTLPHVLHEATDDNVDIGVMKTDHSSLFFDSSDFCLCKFVELSQDECEVKLHSNDDGGYATFSLSHFCFVYLRENFTSEDVIKRGYCICPMFPRQPSSDGTSTYHFCVTFFMKPCIEAIKKQFSKENCELVRHRMKRFTFKCTANPSIEAVVEDMKTECGWMAVLDDGNPSGSQVIMASSVDLWKKEQDELELEIDNLMYPPCFHLTVCHDAATGPTTIVLRFNGVEKEFHCSVVLPLSKLDQTPIEDQVYQLEDCDLESVEDKTLTEDDLADVTGALIGVESKYYSIGLAIGLRVHELDCIRANYGKDVQEALGQVMVAWFHLNYNSVRFGLPTWRKIVEVVHKVNGGNHCALAKSIAANHPLHNSGGLHGSQMCASENRPSVESPSDLLADN